MKNRLAPVLMAVAAILLIVIAYLMRPAPMPPTISRPQPMPDVADLKPVPAAFQEVPASVVVESEPMWDREDLPSSDSAADDVLEPIPAPIMVQEDEELDQLFAPSTEPETRRNDDSGLGNADYPNTFISAIEVDLASPSHWVRLTWTGPQADAQETGPFHSSPGAGLGYNDCNDPAESMRQDSNCTPKGTFKVEGFNDHLPTYAHCKYVTWFYAKRGIAFHYYPDVPDYPASHGCVRLDEHAARLIHDNSKINETSVTVGGAWARQ